MKNFQKMAEEAHRLKNEYGLSYAQQVNLEAVMNKMLNYMPEAQVIDCVEDLAEWFF